MTDVDEWGHANDAAGEFARPEVLAGHLCIVWPLGYVPHIQTKFTTPGKKSDAICCDIVDLDAPDQNGAPGKVYRLSNLMQGKLIGALKNVVGTKVLGVFDKGIPTNGMNAPWILTDVSANPNARERASAWLAAHTDFRPSTFVAPVAAPPPPPAPPQPQYQQQGPPAWPQQPPQQYGGGGYQPPQQPPQYGGGYNQPAQQPGQYYQQQPGNDSLMVRMASEGAQQYRQAALPPQQPPAPPQRPQSYPVPGAAPLSNEDLDTLQRMRMARAQQDQSQADPWSQPFPPQQEYGEQPPF
jgi:hypothetical protein